MKNFKKILNSLILKTNETILISNINVEDFSYKIIINSDLLQKDLAIVDTHPLWLIELELLSKKKNNVLLIIKDIDLIDEKEQLRFLEIIKYRSVNGFKLPNNAHIILSCQNLDNVSNTIKSHCLVIKGD